MFKSKSKNNIENCDFDSKLINMKQDLFYIKKARNENTVDAYYNNNFNFLEIPEKRNFVMSGTSTNQTISNEVKKLRKNKKNQVVLRNRLQNCDIEDTFYLKFKKGKESVSENIDFIYDDIEIDNNNEVELDFLQEEEQEKETESIFLNEDQEKIKLYNENYNNSKYNEDHNLFEDEGIKININFLTSYLDNNGEKTKKYNKIKNNINNEIPLNCYTTWHTKNIPPNMYNNFESLKEKNPELTFHFYDETDCKLFIQQYFDKSVYHAYIKLVPSSYKSDLWRYCVLYVNGGTYIDIKYNTINGCKLIDLYNREQFVYDHYKRGTIWEKDEMGLYTSLIIVKPKNQILFQCIQKIVKYCEHNYYGKNAPLVLWPCL